MQRGADEMRRVAGGVAIRPVALAAGFFGGLVLFASGCRVWLACGAALPEGLASLPGIVALGAGLVADAVAAAFLTLPLAIAAVTLAVRCGDSGQSSRWPVLYAAAIAWLWVALHAADALFFPFSARRLGLELFSFFSTPGDLWTVLGAGWRLGPAWITLVVSAAAGFAWLAWRLRASRPPAGSPRGAHALLAATLIASALSPLSTYVSVGAVSPHGVYEELEQNLLVNLIRERVLLAYLPEHVPVGEETDRWLGVLFPDRTESGDAFVQNPGPAGRPGAAAVRNVVLILLEGVWTGDLNPRDAPGLWRYARATEAGRTVQASPAGERVARFFPRFYASGLRTRNGLFALLAGWPDLVNYSAVKTYALYSNYSTAPELLRRRGFRTVFVYGGDPAFEGYDRFVRRAGVQTIVGRADLAKRATHREAAPTAFGEAYHDDVVLEEVAGLLRSTESRQFITAMLSSTHAPFTVPGGASRSYADALRFTDATLSKFLNRFGPRGPDARIGDRTVFIITSDHTHQQLPSGLPESEIFRVPFVWIAPDPGLAPPPGATPWPAGQPDLLATFGRMFGADGPVHTAGRDLFKKNESNSFAFGNAGSRVFSIDRCGAYRVNLRSGKFTAIFDPAVPTLIAPCRAPAAASRRTHLKKKTVLLAYFQRTRNRLLRNDFPDHVE